MLKEATHDALRDAIKEAVRGAPVPSALEAQSQTRMLKLADEDDCVSARRLEAHFTASAFVFTPDGDTLALFHTKLQRWLQPGGHIEVSDATPLGAALREAHEETRLRDLEPLSCSPIDLDIHKIPSSARGPAHEHFDLRYALLYRGAFNPTINDESQGWCWLNGERLNMWARDPSIGRALTRGLRLL